MVYLMTLSIRLTKDIVDYIIEHSGAKLILVDHEFAHLVKGTSVPVIVSHDTGKSDDPYEQFLGEKIRLLPQSKSVPRH